jgi:hexosaminidase
MRPYTILLLLSFFILAPAFSQDVTLIPPRIIPMPQQIVAKPAQFKVTSSTKIILGVASPSDNFTAREINEDLLSLDKHQLKVVQERSVRKLTSNFIFIGSPSTEFGARLLRQRHGILTPAMKAEGYFLDVDDNGVVIIAESGKGRFYGAMSLLQLLHMEKKKLEVEGVTISDYPAEKFRGISDDISRGQVSTEENFKKIIRFIARYKMNVYSLYMEDMFHFQSYPLIGKGRGALTAEEVKDLDEYAKQYHVDLIPIFETLGHWENILQMPQYADLAEFPGAQTLNVSDARVYTMLDNMIRELSSTFSSPYFNMGADESWDVGLGANKEEVAKMGIAAVHAEHYKRVISIIRKYGKKPMMYGDIILNNPDILAEIPKDVIIVDWHYGGAFEYGSPEVFRKAGFQFIVSPAVTNFTGPFPNYPNTFVNIRELNRTGRENGSLGLLTSSWNDYGGEELRELNYLGYAWGAECSWYSGNTDSEGFTAAFLRDFYGTSDVSDIQAAYSILSDPGNQYLWHELWRDPMLPFRQSQPGEDLLPLAIRVQSIRMAMPLALSLLEKAKSKVTRNTDHLQYLEFVANLNLWFAKKITAQEEVQRLCASVDQGANRDSVEEAVESKCNDVVGDLESLRRDFERLWLLTNKPQGIQYLLMRYDRQAEYWEEKIAEVKEGIFQSDPVIESKWIYHPLANPGKHNSSQIQTAYFRKSFTLPNGIQSAKLQLIGDSFARAFVNGTEIGGVSARRSLSLAVEETRVKVFDILPLLKDSMNVIAVEAKAFGSDNSAGFNIYCEIQYPNGVTRKIMSDETWKVADSSQVGWNTITFNDSSWVNAQSQPYPFTVDRPDFATGTKSWIEQ